MKRAALHREGSVSKATLAKLLRTLGSAGVIKVVHAGAGRRAGVFAFAELINICEGKPVV